MALERDAIYGESQVVAVKDQLAWLDQQLNGKEFIAGPRFTIADITAFVSIGFVAALSLLKVDPELRELAR